jgi:hypothetical protein
MLRSFPEKKAAMSLVLTWRRVCCIVVVFAAVGCSKNPHLVPAAGTIQAQGQPVANATVQFTPDPVKNPSGFSATAQVGDDGAFRLQTPPHGEGAMPGSYRVTVTGYPGQKLSFPSKYTRLDQTTLLVEIPPEGKSDLILKLD